MAEADVPHDQGLVAHHLTMHNFVKEASASPSSNRAFYVLQSIVKNKARGFLIGGRTKPPREDVITDCVFGGLRYFDKDKAGLVLHIMTPGIFPPDACLKSIHLWPRGKCEPDAIIVCTLGDASKLTVIIEAKWGSNPLWSEQLDRQWEEFGRSALLEGDVKHLVVVEHRARVELAAVEEAPAEMKPHRHLTTWYDIATNLRWRKNLTCGDGFARWIEDVVAVLNEAGQRPFSGFSKPLTVDSIERQERSYYSANRFVGIRETQSVSGKSIFFRQSE